jgi:hypothetical protein
MDRPAGPSRVKRLYAGAGAAVAIGLAVTLLAGRDRGETFRSAVVPHESPTPAAAAIPLSAPHREVPQPKRLIPVRMGTYVEWSHHEQKEPVAYRMGEMTVTVIPPEWGWGGITRQIRIQAPGRPDYVNGNDVLGEMPARLGYGRFDRAGTPYLLVETFTGGAHCCGAIELFILRPGRTEHVELGMWEGFPVPDVRDYDGDGTVDFVVDDRAFMNRFTSWAEGRTPPVVLNVVGGEGRDVSARPGFRPLFAHAARELREECLHPDRISPNGACAAYVAAAGRAGNFRRAWAEMLKAYDRKSKDGLEAGCRIPIAANEYCPKGLENYRSYPQALRAFLREQGFPAG